MVKLFLKNSNLCDHYSPTSQTDGRTDRQTTCDRNTALCTKVHRAVIIGEFKVTFHGNPIMWKNLHSSSPTVPLESVHDFKHTLYNCVTTVYCHIGQNKSLKSSTLIYDTTFDDLLNALTLLVMYFACKFCPIDW